MKGGFGNPNNSYAPYYAEFGGYLYLTTNANPSGSVFSGSNKAGGDIWRTADGTTWEQVGTPGFGNADNITFTLVSFHDRLYAVSSNAAHGIEVWVTSNGTDFSKLEAGGFGDKENYFAFPLTYGDRLILGVSNLKTGAQIWVSDDGLSFRKVVDGGLGDAQVTGIISPDHPEAPETVFQGRLYLGVTNPRNGGEIWRTSDGENWERVADDGLGRKDSISLSPDTIYRGQLYAFGMAGGTLDNLHGFDLFRSYDGTKWEKVIDQGFGLGLERNVGGFLAEFKDRLYLTTQNMDPRLLNPTGPTERHPPAGFQLYVSDDGQDWKQVGKDGFGAESSLLAGLVVYGSKAYLSVTDYHQGGQLWTSTDGQTWDLAFREPEPNMFQEGGGAYALKGHLLWISNDLKNGIEIWRSDGEVVSLGDSGPTRTEGQSSTTTAAGLTTGSLSGESSAAAETAPPASSDTAGASRDGAIEPPSDSASTVTQSGLSGGLLAVIIVLAVLLVAALVAVAFMMGQRRAGRRS